jgi:hypothetical protein
MATRLQKSNLMAQRKKNNYIVVTSIMVPKKSVKFFSNFSDASRFKSEKKKGVYKSLFKK